MAGAIPVRSPVVGPDALMTPQWVKYFAQDSSIADLNAQAATLTTRIETLQGQADTLAASLVTMQALVDSLQSQIGGMFISDTRTYSTR